MGRTFAANVLEETEKGFFSKAQAQATRAYRLDSKTLLRYFLALAHLITSWLVWTEIVCTGAKSLLYLCICCASYRPT